MTEFTIDNKKISIYKSSAPNKPVIYLNMYTDEGGRIYKLLQNLRCPDFSLVSISNLDWNSDMTPWDIPPIFKNDIPYTGKADNYLQILTEKIVPEAEAKIAGHALWRAIAGYSLGGLFAIYSLYKTASFSRAASISGSLWFLKIKEFIFSHEMKIKPDYLYFSLGDKECKTRNPYLKEVQHNTQELEAFYRSKNINTIFQLNPGNHYHQAAERTAAGINWLLNR